MLEDGRKVTVELFQETLRHELRQVRIELGEQQFGVRKFHEAAKLLDKLVTNPRLPAFMTLEA